MTPDQSVDVMSVVYSVVDGMQGKTILEFFRNRVHFSVDTADIVCIIQRRRRTKHKRKGNEMNDELKNLYEMQTQPKFENDAWWREYIRERIAILEAELGINT